MTKNKRKTWQKNTQNMTNHVAICTLRRFVCFVDSGCLAPASMAPESHVGYPSTHDNTRQVDSHSVRKCSQNVHFLKFCFKLETQIWQSVSIWQRDEKRVMKREKALCITFQNGFSHFNLWTWSSSSRDVRRKKVCLCIATEDADSKSSVIS